MVQTLNPVTTGGILLRPYQLEIYDAILDSVLNHRGLTFAVEIARQGGKNEISAQLEMFLLILNAHRSEQMIKCSPTFDPQTLISKTRLEDRLDQAGFRGRWTREGEHILGFGDARAVFLSADRHSNVVGNTAHLLLEVDESQDVDHDKYTKDFKPMGATTNCTVVHYGTTWDDSSLLESIKQTNLELQKKDGFQRNFKFDYLHVGQFNPAYRLYVETERERLGENHPLFLTQYRLMPLHGGGGFLNYEQREHLQGDHSRLHGPSSPSLETHNSKLKTHNSPIYVASIDLAGEIETTGDAVSKILHPKRDSTVITIAELDFKFPDLKARDSELLTQKLPFLRIVEHYVWTGITHTDLYPRMVDLLKGTWKCSTIVIDATGMGGPIASAFIRDFGKTHAFPFTFTPKSKSELGFNLLAAIETGRLKMYTADNSPEYQEFWNQMERAKCFFRPNQTLNFFVDPSDGHDDFLMSLAMLVEAPDLYQEPRIAYGR